jgi:general nucleoside transport system permease protein
LSLILILQSLLQASLRLATPLIYTSVGETYNERAGVVNIGLEGLMLIGACAAYVVTFHTHAIALAVLTAALIAGLFGAIFAYVTITLQANQIVTGTAMNLIGLGLSSFVVRVAFRDMPGARVEPLAATPIPVLSQIPFIGPILFDQNWLVYGALLLTVVAALVLNKTMLGLSIRAVGEHPRAVATAGLPVARLRYGAAIFGAMLAGVGGAYLPVAWANIFVENMVAGRGFIALAIVVFGRWTPVGALLASIMFGFMYALQLRLQTQNLRVAYQFLQVLPYLATLVIMIIMRGQSAQPKAMGTPYTEQA